MKMGIVHGFIFVLVVHKITKGWNLTYRTWINKLNFLLKGWAQFLKLFHQSVVNGRESKKEQLTMLVEKRNLRFPTSSKS